MFLPVGSRVLWYCAIASFFLRTVSTAARYPVGLYPQYGGLYPSGGPLYPGAGLGGCPVCDSSVYSYCSHKMIHDSCCCGDEYYTGNAFECEFADCSYIHANSCRESGLIIDCCCEEPYRRSYNPVYANLYKK